MGTHSIDSLLKRGLEELDCSGAVFIAIAQKSSTSKLSQAFSGIKALDNSEAVALNEVLDEMKALAAEVHPIPISWKPQIIREILADRRRVRNGSPPMEQFYGVETTAGVYFISYIHGQVKVVHRDRLQAIGMSLGAANRVVDALRAMGYEDAKIFPHPVCGPNVAATDFSDVWR